MKVECDNCGGDLFVIIYDEQAQGYHAECDSCRMVCLKLRSA